MILWIGEVWLGKWFVHFILMGDITAVADNLRYCWSLVHIVSERVHHTVFEMQDFEANIFETVEPVQ